jgi:hypothetical protein
MADAAGLGPVDGNIVGVQIPPPALGPAHRIARFLTWLDLANKEIVMSFRAKATASATATATATATAIAVAVACLLFAPAALASPVQVTGKQLKSALLPASDFVAGYVTSNVSDSGSKLEHGRVWNVATMTCRNFWNLAGVTEGFGETAFAASLVDDKAGTASIQEIFEQGVYQFASTHPASSFYLAVNARYRSCSSVSEPDGMGGTARIRVHSLTKQRVGGHHALRVIAYVSDSKLAGTTLSIDFLWTVAGTHVYMIDAALVNTASPRPTLASLTLKLITRVSALK